MAALCKTMQVRTDAAIYARFKSTKSSKTELHPPLTYVMFSARASNTLTLWHVSLENPGFLLLHLQRRQNITKSKRDGKNDIFLSVIYLNWPIRPKHSQPDTDPRHHR